jgi:carbonic anhydrase
MLDDEIRLTRERHTGGDLMLARSAHHSMSRRRFFGTLGCGCAAAFLTGPVFSADAPKTTLTADQALDLLKRGNADFVGDRPEQVMTDHTRRLSIAAGQAPFASIVGCADSRVPPEILFNRGLGELFTVRVAGNTVDQTALGSIEYGFAVLGSPLIVVLGHSACGAVEAAVKLVTEDARYPGSIEPMIAAILPAVVRAQRQPGNLLDNAIKINVQRVVEQLKGSDAMIAEPVQSGTLKIVGATYDLASGRVEFME